MSPVRAREMAQVLKKTTTCTNCKNVLTSRHSFKYCSNICQKDYQYKIFIESWKNGKCNGVIGNTSLSISRHIKKYLLDKNNYKCEKCSWSGFNKFSNKSVLEINHIEGNAPNNSETNLELLCPNCHSLTNNFRNLNKGKGRTHRSTKKPT